MVNVYVSSTFKDLRDYRQKVRDALAQLGFKAAAMEYYVAEDCPPVERCLADIEQCDIYLGVYAWRSGWVPEKKNPDGLSMTHLEYQHAVAHGKPCLIFLLD